MNEKQIRDFLRNLENTDRYRELLKIKEWSMLHWEVLAIMEYFSQRTTGPIVELGPYLGAGTTVLAAAAREQILPIITVEMGGAHDHPTLPSNDILFDLKANLKRHGVQDRVIVVEGVSRDPVIVARIGDLLDGRQIGLLVMDTDGMVEEDLRNFGQFCSPDCLLVIDDYFSTGAPEKATLIKPVIDALRNQGKLIEYGVYGWGTWIGQISGNEQTF